jgi:hypothetical protein
MSSAARFIFFDHTAAMAALHALFATTMVAHFAWFMFMHPARPEETTTHTATLAFSFSDLGSHLISHSLKFLEFVMAMPKFLLKFLNHFVFVSKLFFASLQSAF